MIEIKFANFLKVENKIYAKLKNWDKNHKKLKI